MFRLRAIFASLLQKCSRGLREDTHNVTENAQTGYVGGHSSHQPKPSFSRNSDRISPLHTAALSGDKRGILTLIEKGANLHAKDDNGDTALHIAVAKGHQDIVELLIANGSMPNCRVYKEHSLRNGVTPLHIAAGEGHEKIIEILLKSGADVNAETDDTPIPPTDQAALMLYLSVYGSDPGAKAERFSAPSIVRVTEDMQARLLKSHGAVADTLIGDRNQLNTETHKDIDAQLTTTRDIGAELKAELRKNAIEPRGIIPLHLAALRGHQNVVELLLATGAKINARDVTGATALHMASEMGHRDVASVLLANGADIDTKDFFRDTPLQKAILNEHEDVVDLLMTKGPKINDRDETGRTLLHFAAFAGRQRIVDFLIKRQATIDATDAKGETPLHLAASMGHKYVVESLIANGADLNRRNKYGVTPLDKAVHKKRNDVIALLRKHGGIR